MWMPRLGGFILTLAGLAVLMFLSYALYTRANAGLNILVGLGMPVVLLGTLFGATALGLGIWLSGFGRRARPSA
jgi:hypothetical protein